MGITEHVIKVLCEVSDFNFSPLIAYSIEVFVLSTESTSTRTGPRASLTVRS